MMRMTQVGQPRRPRIPAGKPRAASSLPAASVVTAAMRGAVAKGGRMGHAGRIMATVPLPFTLSDAAACVLRLAAGPASYLPVQLYSTCSYQSLILPLFVR